MRLLSANCAAVCRLQELELARPSDKGPRQVADAPAPLGCELLEKPAAGDASTFSLRLDDHGLVEGKRAARGGGGALPDEDLTRRQPPARAARPR